MKTTFFILVFITGVGLAGGDVCTMSADRVIQIQLNCYAVITAPNTQDVSENTCQSSGGHLVFLETIEEQQWLHQELTNLGMPTTYWTGAHEMADNIWFWRSNAIDYFQIDVFRVHNYHAGTNKQKALAIPGQALEQSLVTNIYPYICEKDKSGVFYPPPPQQTTTTNQPLTVSTETTVQTASIPQTLSSQTALFGRFIGVSVNKAFTSSITTSTITICARRCLEIQCSFFCYFPVNQSCLRMLDDYTNGINVTCSFASSCYGV